MSSADGPDGNPSFATRFDGEGRHGNLETMLFESLVYHLIEKGLLTKNDALSIVQSVTLIKRGQTAEEAARPGHDAELALLRRLYESFEALRSRTPPNLSDTDNVRELRPPLHGNAPEFPHED